MRIGELAERTGTSERLLRHYEHAGLLAPQRHPNGYRVYAESAVPIVLRIRSLLAAGLPTRVIREVLPCTSGTSVVAACPGVLEALHERLLVLDRRAAELDDARRALARTIAATEAAR